MKNLNLSSETEKLLAENIRETFWNVGIGSGFLDKTLKGQSIKAKLNKWDFIKLKSFYTAMERLNSQETTYIVEEDICELCVWEIQIQNIVVAQWINNKNS